MLALALFCALSAATASGAENEPFPAPNFALKDFRTGKVVNLGDFRGKPVVINFCYAGCPPCRWEAPSLRKLAKKHPEIVVLAISSSHLDDNGAFAAFVSKYRWDFPVLLDDDLIEKTSEEWGKYSVGKTTNAFDEGMAYPTTFLINRDGMVVGKIVNYIDWETLEMKDVVKHLLNGKLIWYYRYLRRKK